MTPHDLAVNLRGGARVIRLRIRRGATSGSRWVGALRQITLAWNGAAFDVLLARDPADTTYLEVMQAWRRVALGPNMTLLFENHDTALFQIREMLRTERITGEGGIEHELDTYNELVPGDRELSASAFIEYGDRDERDRTAPVSIGVSHKAYSAETKLEPATLASLAEDLR